MRACVELKLELTGERLGFFQLGSLYEKRGLIDLAVAQFRIAASLGMFSAMQRFARLSASPERWKFLGICAKKVQFCFLW